MLEYGILGPLEVRDDGVARELGGPKQRATLALLLLSANRVVSIDRLADELYAGAAPVTALKQVQRQISDLRKTLGAAAIETRSPGYVIRVAPAQLDLTRFERLASEGTEALAAGDALHAAELLWRGLQLWRGTPLADLEYEPFARAPIERLEEIKLAATEQRVEADLALGRHSEVVPELEQLVGEDPLRESFWGQLMVALYRSGRQADALRAYRDARQLLVGELGIEPTPALQQLERRILAHDETLEAAAPAALEHATARSVLAVAENDEDLELLVSVGEPLARLPGRELIVARLAHDEDELAAASSATASRLEPLGGNVRRATFVSAEPAADALRLAGAYDVEVLFLAARARLDDGSLPADFATLLERSPADVALTVGVRIEWTGGGVIVPFGGSDHDWAALELAGMFASAVDEPLRLVGTRADPARGHRDASRLLANASLAVQRAAGVIASPLLVDRSSEALAEAADGATLAVIGLSQRWRSDGLGAVRGGFVRAAACPVLVVHAGPRPSGLAPRDTRTRFSWSLGS